MNFCKGLLNSVTYPEMNIENLREQIYYDSYSLKNPIINVCGKIVKDLDKKFTLG